MIRTLLLTILVEGVVVLAYSSLRKRPAGDLLEVSFIVNIFTQSVLWLVLRLFFRYYLIALLSAEALIWLGEGVLIHRLARDRMNLSGALRLSLWMNAASFGMGWFLPV